MSSDLYSVLGNAPNQEDLKILSSSDCHLKIEKLNAGYGKMEIIHDINLYVAKGQSLCLIGPNGAGKSTILHSIYGFTNILGDLNDSNAANFTNKKFKGNQSMLTIALLITF